MHFASPYYLWLLTLLVPMIGYYVWRTLQGGASIQISSVAGVVRAPRTVRYYLRHLPFALRAAAFALLVVALARPQDVEQNVRTNTEGIDIMLAIDVSGSMLARDFKPDRITAAKEVAGSFIADRYGDRIGLVAFAGEAFTQSPLTTDQSTLQTLLARIRSGLIEDGTAIGNGLATAINRLRESDAKSKVIILLTDGVNNQGQIAPMTAAEIAKAQGIRVYTIGVGTEGMAPYPAIDKLGNLTFVNQKVEIDEKVLKAISDMTGGRFFRATDKEKLKAVYDEINQLEKSKIEVMEHISYYELFLTWALAALGLLFAEFLAFEPRTEANTLTERRFRSPGKVLPLPRGGFRRKCRYSTGTASALMQTRRVEYGQKQDTIRRVRINYVPFRKSAISLAAAGRPGARRALLAGGPQPPQTARTLRPPRHSGGADARSI